MAARRGDRARTATWRAGWSRARVGQEVGDLPVAPGEGMVGKAGGINPLCVARPMGDTAQWAAAVSVERHPVVGVGVPDRADLLADRDRDPEVAPDLPFQRRLERLAPLPLPSGKGPQPPHEPPVGAPADEDPPLRILDHGDHDVVMGKRLPPNLHRNLLRAPLPPGPALAPQRAPGTP